MNEWYNDSCKLKNSILFLMKFSCCYSWNAFVKKKTPCCDYNDIDVPPGLENALWDYIESLPREDRAQLNKSFSALVGECFYVREAVIVRILSRILAGGEPYKNREILKYSLEMQIVQRKKLLEML